MFSHKETIALGPTQMPSYWWGWGIWKGLPIDKGRQEKLAMSNHPNP